MRPINLLPARDLRKRGARRMGALLAVIVVVYLIVLGAITLLWNSRVDAAEEDLADQQQVNQALQAEVGALAAADELRLEYEQNVMLTASVLDSDIAWGRLLNDFGRLIPERVWLETFVGTAAAGGTPGLVGRITIAGTGFDFVDVSAWLRSLDETRFPGVTGTWVTSASEAQGLQEGDTLVIFSSTAGLNDTAVSNRVQDRIPEVAG